MRVRVALRTGTLESGPGHRIGAEEKVRSNKGEARRSACCRVAGATQRRCPRNSKPDAVVHRMCGERHHAGRDLRRPARRACPRSGGVG